MICTGRRTNPLFSSLSLSLSSALACSAGLVVGAGGTKPKPSSVTGSCAGPKASGTGLLLLLGAGTTPPTSSERLTPGEAVGELSAVPRNTSRGRPLVLASSIASAFLGLIT